MSPLTWLLQEAAFWKLYFRYLGEYSRLCWRGMAIWNLPRTSRGEFEDAVREHPVLGYEWDRLEAMKRRLRELAGEDSQR